MIFALIARKVFNPYIFLVFGFLFCLLFTPSYAKATSFQMDTNGTLTTNLVSYCKMEDATDSFASNNLTEVGSSTYVAAKIGNGGQEGTNNSTIYWQEDSNLGFTGGNSFSFAAWIKINTLPVTTERMAISVESASNNDFLYIGLQTNGHVRWVRGRQFVVSNYTDANENLATSTWYHIALTYDGSKVTGYFNGSSIGTVSSTGDGSGTGHDGFVVAASIASEHLIVCRLCPVAKYG